MPTAKLVIRDEVNVKFRGLDPETLDMCQERLTYYVPGHVHMAKFISGRWDGKIRLFKSSGSTYLNLTDQLFDIFDLTGYDIDIEDERTWEDDVSQQLQYIDEHYLGDYTLDGEPIVLRDHQVRAVNTALDDGQGVLELATGSGKTLICGILSKIFSEHGKVVVMVPSIDLIVQTQYAFKNIGIDAGIWFGEVKDRKQVTIATWQSLDNYPELFSDVICVLVDEVHQAKAQVISEILSGPAANVPFRFGCTGTMPKEDLFRMQILGTIGRIIMVVRSKELQDLGILAHANVHQIVLKDTKNPRFLRAVDHFKDWRKELNWIFGEPQRVEFMINTIADIANSGNTLVLVPFRKHGKVLAEGIRGSVSLDGRDKKRHLVYDEFNETDGNVLICTFGIASTGIDIPRIFNLVILEPGKKFEKVMQTFGRGLRIAEDKDILNVYDICGDGGLSKRHGTARRKLYRDAEQELNIIEVEYYDADSNT